MINHFYSKSKFLMNILISLKKILSECEKYNYLSEVNAFLIEKISELLKLDYNFNLSSKISSTGYKSDKLISICKSLNQEKYLTNEGAMIYLNKDLHKFKKNKVDLYKITFEKLSTINCLIHLKKIYLSLMLFSMRVLILLTLSEKLI